MNSPMEWAHIVRRLSSSMDAVDAMAATMASDLDLSDAREIARLWLAEQARAICRDEALAAERAATNERQRQVGNLTPEMKAARERAGRELVAAGHAIRERHVARMGQIVADFAAELRMEWTAELLASEFALPNGSVVTWGAATIGDHGARSAMFAANAVANAEGAARHVAAIKALRDSGATCLNELPALR